MADNIQEKSAKNVFDDLNSSRGAVIDRALLCAKLTIPYLFREVTSTDADDLEREYVQGFGAKLVNHLVGKFALSILPPSQPFYRLSAAKKAMDAIAQGNRDMEFEVDKVLAQKEDEALKFINKSKFRTSLYPALRLAMVTGESLIEKVEGKYRVFNLNNYVIKRDGSGNIVELVIKEILEPDTVPEYVLPLVSDKGDDELIVLYTRCYLVDGIYNIYQEIDGNIISGTEGTLKKLSEKFISVGWNKVDGEDYRRSFVEEHLGTLIALNKQLKVINESAIIASKTIFTLNPNGMTKYKDLVRAKNGAVIIGQEQDIGTVKVQKQYDMQLTYNLVNDYKKELAEAFLMGSASIRDAERVTVVEVKLVATELEASFGGIYTSIVEDIQLPVIENALSELNIKTGKDIDVIITTGVEALGRNVELQKINNLMQELSAIATLVGQEAIVQEINISSIISAMVANSGVASKNFLYSPQEKEQAIMAQREEQMSQQYLSAGLPQMGTNMANMEAQSMTQNGEM